MEIKDASIDACFALSFVLTNDHFRLKHYE